MNNFKDEQRRSAGRPNGDTQWMQATEAARERRRGVDSSQIGYRVHDCSAVIIVCAVLAWAWWL